jgi:hypothetical protein
LDGAELINIPPETARTTYAKYIPEEGLEFKETQLCAVRTGVAPDSGQQA